MPLIYLVRVSLAEAIRRLSGEKLLTPGVYGELLKGESLGKPEASIIRELVERSTIKLAHPHDRPFVQRLIRLAAEDEKRPLHQAEAEALALAKEIGGIVISDDRVARSVAKLVHVNLHGTGYLLGRMQRDGLLSKEEVISKIEEMRRSGWRLSEEDYRTVLEYLRRP